MNLFPRTHWTEDTIHHLTSQSNLEFCSTKQLRTLKEACQRIGLPIQIKILEREILLRRAQEKLEEILIMEAKKEQELQQIIEECMRT
ncbi:hypothetical protein C3H94_02580 [Campylobacter jejuni]|uniref:DUF115 domain-containing protein n=1 Tax=Campylobacter jejuni TaxID=197 RepID=A0A431C162_CAMJU|nr:hypothetical protein [Campylobacter jejuni]EAJ7141062.1 hypothetical protein [Campylobacter jejuni]EAK9985893.1 hypothetical protein [Campylobacter jejuni]RTI74067.1 hypothetical protein C3I15_01480 [Campylobacter jejuni]RTI84096.1 hypothetical protein C3I10_00020 [Campylobacter jejuni]RTJ05664.1 hypothetical protein C3H99_03260 [Campylobacter jejuni]